MTVQIERRRWTTEEYHTMLEADLLKEDDNVELIDGDIVTMAAVSSRHAGCVNRLAHIFSQQIGAEAIVSVQNPIQLDDFSEPEPDIALLKPRDDFYADSHPQPSDLFLIVEVADTSLEYDRAVKARLYAEAGIPEMWLVDLVDNVIDVYRAPAPDGYTAVDRVQAGVLSPEQFAEVEIRVEEIIP